MANRPVREQASKAMTAFINKIQEHANTMV